MLPITKKISAYNSSARGSKIEYIVIHDVGGTSTAANNASYFSRPVNPPASAHYFTDPISIYHVIADERAAWHVGDGRGRYGITNSNSIGIEMCLTNGKIQEKTIENTIDLTKYLMKKYSVPASRVVRHYDASRKNCPAQFNLDGKWTKWYQFHKRLTTQAPPVTNKPTETASTFKIGDKVKVSGKLYASSDGSGASSKSKGKEGTVKKIFGYNKKYHVVGSGFSGWAAESDLSAKSTSKPSTGNTKTVTIDNLNVYTSQSLSSPIVKTASGYRILKKGTKVKVTATANNGQSVHGSKNWSEVDGFGWVPSVYLK